MQAELLQEAVRVSGNAGALRERRAATRAQFAGAARSPVELRGKMSNI